MSEVAQRESEVRQSRRDLADTVQKLQEQAQPSMMGRRGLDLVGRRAADAGSAGWRAVSTHPGMSLGVLGGITAVLLWRRRR
jgi:hypothetical protein